MSKSIEELIKSLKQFDEPHFKGDHEALTVEIPQGMLRYGNLYDTGGITDAMNVYLAYRDKALSFSVKIADRSKLKRSVIAEDKANNAGDLQHFRIEDVLELSMKDARKLFFYLLESYACFTVSVQTIERKCR
jgi:hypothetical protein